MTWRNKAKPLYLEWETFGLFGVAGSTGSGKSSTTLFLLAQLALAGVGLIVADGHGRAGNESLAERAQPLSRALLYPIAIDPSDVLDTIKYVESIMRRRINDKEPTDQKIAFVIDEYTSLMLRMTPQQAKQTTELLLLISQEARKTNVRGFLLGHNWSANFIGNAAIRSNLANSVLLHCLAENETKLFFPSAPAKLKREIANLKQGQAFLKTARLDPVKVHIPYITTDDLLSIANFIPDVRSNYDHDIENALESYEMDETVYNKIEQKPKLSLKSIVETILENRKNGIMKKKTIYQIWGVKPGASDTYKAASKFYDAVMREYGILSKEYPDEFR